MKVRCLTVLGGLLWALPAQAESLASYATDCAAALGVTSIQGYSCNQLGWAHDGAGFLVASANNKIGKVSQLNANVDAVFLCRNYNSAANTAGLNGYILQNTITGNTCFFDAKSNASGTVPSPNAANASTFWKTPTAPFDECQTCHSADPFIVTGGLAGTMKSMGMISASRNLKGAYNIVNSNVAGSHFQNWNAERQITTGGCSGTCHQSSNNSFNTNMVNTAVANNWMAQSSYVGSADINPASIGVWRPGASASFWFDWDYNRTWSTPNDKTSAYGTTGDQPFVLRGARCELAINHPIFGVKRGNTWLVSSNNTWWDAADDATSFTWGSGGIPLSWNSVVVNYQNGSFVVDYNQNKTSAGDLTFPFGNAGDAPIIGRWKRGIARRIGTFRGSNGLGYFYLDTNGNNMWDGADTAAQFGNAGDKPFTGDFNGDGIDEIGVFRNGTWFVDKNNNFQWDGTAGGDAEWFFGQAGDFPVVSPGRWNCGGL